MIQPAVVVAGSRAGGLHSRTIEVLDQRGIAERSLAQGQVAQDGVDVEMSDGRLLRTKFLVGCDGGRSLIRKAAGITASMHTAATIINCK